MKRVLLILAMAVTFVLSLAFSPRPRAQGAKRFRMEFAPVQTGAPVQLESVNHSVDFLYNRAEVKNVSSETVRSITFGVLLHDPGSKAVLASSRQISTDIKPGQTRVVDVLNFTRDEAQREGAAPR